jgi:hypothetical protein
MKVTINENKLRKIMNSQVGPIVGKIAEKKIRDGAEKARMQMIKEFESHPVTKEIEGGPDASNKSGTLNGYGNLFSFIGFEYGMDPIGPIRAILNKALTIRSVPSNHRSMITKFIVELPSKEEIFAAAPNPWAAGRSWAQGIEQGMSGFGQYIYEQDETLPKSRSGPAVQGNQRFRAGGYSNTKYLSEILNNLQKNIREMIK